MKLRLSAFAALSLLCLGVSATIPAGYYSAMDGKKDAALKDATYRVIRNLTRVSSYKNLPQYFQHTDVYPNSDRWWDMYSDIPLYAPSFSGLNREHSFPKSWWGGFDDVNAYTDLNHLYPSEAAANQAKSNYPLGVVDRGRKVKFENGVSTVGYPVTGQGGGATYVFEPDDEYKGDFARTYFYMVTCYQDYEWVQKYMYMLQQDTYPTLNAWSVELLLRWSREDPVSQKEIDRNEVVYGYQNNRNPFIDFPELAEYIWGKKRGEAFHVDGGGGEPGPNDPPTGPALLAPTNNMTLDIGQVALGRSIDAQLYIHGQEINGNLSLSLYSGDRSMFSIPVKTIAANLVNSADGYWLKVTYTPSKLGQHTTKLLINNDGLGETTIVNLRGECLQVPELNVCTATEATDITSTSYVANWTAPEQDEIDYFLVTRTIYTNGNVKRVQQVAEENYLLVEDFNDADHESYYVQSSRLGYFSEPSNVIIVSHNGITGVSADEPLCVIGVDGAIRLICSSTHTGVCIYDMAGRLVKYIDEVSANTDIDMPAGIYLVTSRQTLTPHRVIVK